MKGMSTDNFVSQVCINSEVYVWFFKVQSLKTQLRNISCENLINPPLDSNNNNGKTFWWISWLSPCHYFSIWGTCQHSLISWLTLLTISTIWADQITMSTKLSWMGRYLYNFLTCPDRIRKAFCWVAKKEIKDFCYLAIDK